MRTSRLMTTLAMAAAMSLPVLAKDTGSSDTQRAGRDVVVRDNRSVYTVTDRFQPLTSVYLDTTSTRLVDARRGFRPYDTIHDEDRRDSRRLSRRVYQDVYGPTRRAPRGYYDPNPPAPRTSVTAYYGGQREAQSNQSASQPSIMIIIRDERGADRDSSRDAAQVEPQAEQAEQDMEVMEVTIYEGEPEMPENSGAVIVRRDGTVISVGD